MALNAPTKRKVDDEPEPTVRKKRKRKAKVEAQEHLDLENSVNLSIGLMDSQLLSDYFARMTARSGSDLSAVEIADLSISGELLLG